MAGANGEINIAIVGYGNIGRGVKRAIERNPDMRLSAILTRRLGDVSQEVPDVPVYGVALADIISVTCEPLMALIDVAILCGGSKQDLPVQSPQFARFFNIVDSFDTHADIPGHFTKVNSQAKLGGNVAVICAGWDPGIFSRERVLADAYLPGSKIYTFYDRGVSQGHSDAVRKVPGVLDARQYTLPIEEVIEKIRAGETPELTKRQTQKRLVYVVAEPGADKERIQQEIISMPQYFDEYDTEVIFIAQEEMQRDHSTYPHGGFVLTSGVTGDGHKQIVEFRVQLESNPEFTASVLVACARAAYRFNQEGRKGAFTMLDIPASYLSLRTGEELRREFM